MDKKSEVYVEVYEIVKKEKMTNLHELITYLETNRNDLMEYLNKNICVLSWFIEYFGIMKNRRNI